MEVSNVCLEGRLCGQATYFVSLQALVWHYVRYAAYGCLNISTDCDFSLHLAFTQSVTFLALEKPCSCIPVRTIRNSYAGIQIYWLV